MKIFLLSLFVAAAFAAPAPLDEETGENVELIVNGVAEGEPLEIGDVLGIKVKEHAEGVMLSATDLLHPFTAVGIAEAAAADNPTPVDVVEVPEIVEVKPEPVEVVEVPEIVEILPEPIELPYPQFPEIVPVPPVNAPELIPEHVVIPEVPEIAPEAPEVAPETPEVAPEFPEVAPEVPELPEPVPEPIFPEGAPQGPIGEVFNNGLVQVKVNAEPGVISTMQSWFNMVLNYFNGSDVASQQIV